VRESLVVDVGRLATTRDRPSALSAPLSSLALAAAKRVGHHPRSLLFPLLMLVVATVVVVCGHVRK